MRHFPEDDYTRAFMRGFAHALYHLSYRDGTSPPHSLMIVVPGCAFTNPAKRGYRDGWLAGTEARSFPPELSIGVPTIHLANGGLTI